ncbi:MAG: S1 RNA-binding domain-containing protein [Spirochaetales bacterium]|nr:S1 RNA-binding domain-containing protein [Spirochaetales bacterium]
MKKFEPGQAIKAEIVSISNEYIFLQLSGKSEGVLDKEELINKEGKLTVKEGDIIQAFFQHSKNGEMRFTTKLSGDKAGKSDLEMAFENQIPVEGMVEKEIKGGFSIKIGNSQAFCPFSLMGSRRIDNPESYIGQNLVFRIIEYKERGRNILVSNKAIMEEERNKQIDSLKKILKENMDIKGTVTSIQDFGAFIDLGGIQGLLPISEISRDRINDITAILSIGEAIEVKIIKIDWKTNRITLSMKALLDDPWDHVQMNYKIGSMYKGTVVKVTNYGAFISLEPGLDGLLHVSELQGNSKTTNPQNLIKKGETLTVLISDIDKANKRISLKSVAPNEDNTDYQQYMDQESDTYNPFANLMKNKNKK